MPTPPQKRRAARHLPQDADAPATRHGPAGRGKSPITVDSIITAALGIVASEGYEALTMRRLAAALETGPASLYAHVSHKEELAELKSGDAKASRK